MKRVSVLVAFLGTLSVAVLAQDANRPVLKAPPKIDVSGLADDGKLPLLPAPPATTTTSTTTPGTSPPARPGVLSTSSPDLTGYYKDLQQPKRVTELNYLFHRATVEKQYPEYVDVVQGEVTAIAKNMIGLPHYAYLRTIHFTWITNQDKTIRLSFIDSATGKAFGHLDFDSAMKVKTLTAERANVDAAIANIENPYPKVEGNPEIMKIAAIAKAVHPELEKPNYHNNKVRGEFEQLAKEMFGVSSENKHLKLKSHLKKVAGEGFNSIIIGFDFAETQKELGIIGLHFSSDNSKLRFINSRSGLVDPKVLIDEAAAHVNAKR